MNIRNAVRKVVVDDVHDEINTVAMYVTSSVVRGVFDVALDDVLGAVNAVVHGAVDVCVIQKL